MDEIAEFVDERQKSWCIHCRRFLAGLKTNRDHVPTKTLLHPPYPSNLPVVAVCTECNESFSKDEQYVVAFLSSVISGSTDPSAQSNPNAQRILQKNKRLRDRIEHSKREYLTKDGEPRVAWGPEQNRIDRVIVKNARGHAFFEYGEPVLNDPVRVSSTPILSLSPEERALFEEIPASGGWPEVGSRMMTRLMTGQDLDGPWVVVQEGVYRYGVVPCGGGTLVRTVISEYLATEVLWQE